MFWLSVHICKSLNLYRYLILYATIYYYILYIFDNKLHLLVHWQKINKLKKQLRKNPHTMLQGKWQWIGPAFDWNPPGHPESSTATIMLEELAIKAINTTWVEDRQTATRSGRDGLKGIAEQTIMTLMSV